MASKVRPAHAPERKVNPVPRRCADVDKARRLLGFEPVIGLEEGLRQFAAWWQEEQCAKL